MRRARFLLAASSLTVAGFAIWAAGCGTFRADCESGVCDPYKKPDAGAGSGSGGGGVMAACQGDPTMDPSLIRDDCALFVRGDPTDSDMATGTKAQPFKTLQGAIDADVDKWIFVCTKNAFSEAVTLQKGNVQLYGGFDCDTWTYMPTAKTQLDGLPDKIALTITAKGDKIWNFAVQAANATSTSGNSSIAVLVNAADPVFTSCNLSAGDAADGVAGTQTPGDPAQDGDPGANGATACDPGVTHPGPMGKTKTCVTGGSSTGGNGGNGGDPNGSMTAGNGTNGLPANAGGGQGGAGENASLCTGGQDGASGAPGMFGAGAAGIGDLAPTGYSGNHGGDGLPGKPGQGGGGGGGAKGGMGSCGGGTIAVAGASGGAGGTGGCGGANGTGGGPGGSSIALVSLDATVSLQNTTLSSAKAGNGGAGGNGQSGGIGGTGGQHGTGAVTLKASCNGGKGGLGGDGGPGGGGQGGHSFAIAVKGGAAPMGGMPIVMNQVKGVGGVGGLGPMSMSAGKGLDGLSGACWDFTKAASCK